eukprot:g10912.t1
MADDAVDVAQSRVFHVLEVCKVIGAHKQALANHACVRSSIKAMSASVHEAEVLLNAAPTAIDPDDQLARRTCIPDDDPRVEAIVSMMEQEGNGKALASLKNLAAERYWDSRWQREWETKYHDPLVGIKRQEQEFIALGALDIGMQRRRAQRVRAALKDRERRPEFDPAKRTRERAQEFVLRRRRGPTGERCLGGRPRTAFGVTNRPVMLVAQNDGRVEAARAAREPAPSATAAAAAPGRMKGRPDQGGRNKQGQEGTGRFDVRNGRVGQGKHAPTIASRPSQGHVDGEGEQSERRPRSRCPRFDNGPGWDEAFTAKVLSRLAKLDPPVHDYTEGALDSIAKKDDEYSAVGGRRRPTPSAARDGSGKS